MKLFKGISILLLLVALQGCDVNDDDVDYHFVTLNIVDAVLPQSFQQNQTYEILVTYQLPNGCTSFEGFDIISEDTTIRRVVAIGSKRDGQACTQAIEEVQTSFQFICLYSDTYVFRFFTGLDENDVPQYMEYEVPVN
ncbi:hypothetical protein OZ410_03815 [Robiginitalea sp. M366]|uniref:hypothetical protein n=1 Tax=Robiginitalea aestuariiviva TaxID=3036903 RepID=UPI00240DB2D2|nr:hypothetical protein [Robiginitalea aestuariiviva]MDG1571428.1 hypothetical protein [Robiginitalea aestuariiviva]